MGVSVAREEDPAASRWLLEALTARLPQWFAQPDSNRHYAEQAEVLEALIDAIEGHDPYEPYRRTRAFYERLGFELVLSREPLACYLKLL